MPLNGSTGLPPSSPGPRQPAGSLRAAVIAELGAKIASGQYPASLETDLQRAIAGQTIQLTHRAIPARWRPDAVTWSLYELRGEELVGVPAWRYGSHPPAEWTAPPAPGHPMLLNDPRSKFV
jgi:hypothetical protein